MIVHRYRKGLIHTQRRTESDGRWALRFGSQRRRAGGSACDATRGAPAAVVAVARFESRGLRVVAVRWQQRRGRRCVKVAGSRRGGVAAEESELLREGWSEARATSRGERPGVVASRLQERGAHRCDELPGQPVVAASCFGVQVVVSAWLQEGRARLWGEVAATRRGDIAAAASVQ